MGFFDDLLDGVMETVTNIGDAVVDGLYDLQDKLDDASDNFNDTLDAAEELGEILVDGAKDIGSVTADAILEIPGAIAEDISNNIEVIKDASLGFIIPGALAILCGAPLIVTVISAAAGATIFGSLKKWESGEIEATKEEIQALATTNRTDFIKAYEQNKDNMSEDVRTEWEKYL